MAAEHQFRWGLAKIDACAAACVGEHTTTMHRYNTRFASQNRSFNAAATTPVAVRPVTAQSPRTHTMSLRSSPARSSVTNTQVIQSPRSSHSMTLRRR